MEYKKLECLSLAISRYKEVEKWTIISDYVRTIKISLSKLIIFAIQDYWIEFV